MWSRRPRCWTRRRRWRPRSSTTPLRATRSPWTCPPTRTLLAAARCVSCTRQTGHGRVRGSQSGARPRRRRSACAGRTGTRRRSPSWGGRGTLPSGGKSSAQLLPRGISRLGRPPLRLARGGSASFFRARTRCVATTFPRSSPRSASTLTWSPVLTSRGPRGWRKKYLELRLKWIS
eukprot:scaffold7640_cov239-Pinguiococcus_pyrenoidosus.AAC.1